LDLIKDFTQSKHAILANNGTLALFLGLLLLDVGKGDEVMVPDFTFNASASSVTFTGAKPVFVDIDEGNLNIAVEKIESAITDKTKAIMPVHIYGQAADMDPVIKLAKKHDLRIIEDAAQAYGVFYKGKHAGTMGDVGIISFYADKTVTCGEGAAILTNNDALYEKLRYLRNQGRLESGGFMHPQLGMNFRVTDLQCAVGVAQLRKFKEIERRKKANYRLYQSLLSDLSEISFITEVGYSNFVPFRALIKAQKLEKLIQYLEDKQIQTRRFFYPLHRQPCFNYLGYREGDFPVSNKAYSEGLCLPVFPSLKKEQIKYVCEKIKEFYREG